MNTLYCVEFCFYCGNHANFNPNLFFLRRCKKYTSVEWWVCVSQLLFLKPVGKATGMWHSSFTSLLFFWEFPQFGLNSIGSGATARLLCFLWNASGTNIFFLQTRLGKRPPRVALAPEPIAQDSKGTCIKSFGEDKLYVFAGPKYVWLQNSQTPVKNVRHIAEQHGLT